MLHFHSPFSKGRRQFLFVSTAVAAGALAPPDTKAAGTDKVFLKRGEHGLFRVRIEMDVKGNVDIPRNALVSRKVAKKLPIQSDAVFDYEERYRRPEGADKNSVVTTVERYYHEAKSQSQLNRSEQTLGLRDSVRETVVRRETLPEVVYGVEDFFAREELELLRLPVSSVAVDELLPDTAVTSGSKYKPSMGVLSSVLNLTSVEASDVEAEVVSITDQIAKIEFRGKLDGSVEGVPTVIRVVGKLTFDRTAETTTWLAMAIHETREIGKAEPGFDVAATIKMVRKPLTTSVALAPQSPKLDITGPIPSDRLYVALNSSQLGIHMLMGREWRMMRDVPGAAMMRMVDSDRSIGQCDFLPLVALKPGQKWSLEAFQRDIRGTLGEQLNDLVEADERVSPAGMRVLRVVALGAVEGVPIRWVVLHFSDDSGRRVLATFTMEGHNVDAFAGADLQLAGTLRFGHPGDQEPQEVALNAAQGDSRPQVAQAKSGGDSPVEVQSTGNLR